MSEFRFASRSRIARFVRGASALCLLSVVFSAPTMAQTVKVPPRQEGELRMQAYTLRHQPAGDAVALISPLLSDRGSVELQPLGNTIVVRDEPSRIVRIMPVLRSFDHPRRTVRLEVRIVRASVTAQPRTATARQLSSVVTKRLRDLLRFQHYDVLAGADLESREGDPVQYDVGGDYRVELRVGTVLASRRLKLHDFRIARAGSSAEEEWVPLLHTNLELTIEEPMVLGLAPDEASRHALMVVLTARPELSVDGGGVRAE